MTLKPKYPFVIVDTGCANLASVKFAVKRLGFNIVISDDIDIIKNAEKVILPGVGSARHAMENIKAKGLVSTLQQLTQPVLGFCLGMQLMASSSVEGIKLNHNNTKTPDNNAENSAKNNTKNNTENDNTETIECLGVIPIDIRPLDAKKLRMPHMGWNTLTKVTNHPVFAGINTGDYFYFVHSFAAPISAYTVAQCQYGNEFSAAIAKNNFIGCQFHPERSSELGSKIIKNFLEM